MRYYTLLFAFLFISSNVNAQQNLRINQLQVIGSHNSYKKEIGPNLYKFLEQKDSSNNLKALQYAHISIPEQLTLGLRNLEIDVYADTKGGRYATPKGIELVKPTETYDPNKVMLEPGFKMLHVLDIDFRSHYYTLVACLQDLKKWSNAHPKHEPVFITLEAKDGSYNGFGTEPEEFTKELFNQLDASLINYLGKEKIIIPDDVRGHFSTLKEAVLNNNWPKLKKARGKFLFILDDTGSKRDMYIKDHPSLQGRVLFVNADPETPEAATLLLNDPRDENILKLVKKGYIIRTRADSGTKEARTNNYSRFEKAKESGAQIISTDYYYPSTFFKSEYQVSFKNKTYVRNNPITKK